MVTAPPLVETKAESSDPLPDAGKVSVFLTQWASRREAGQKLPHGKIESARKPGTPAALILQPHFVVE